MGTNGVKMRAMGKRVIIVGGGHNGLVCACYLAGAGAEVTLLEQRQILGGAAVTEEFHPGFRNSTASYTVSLLHPRIIQELRLVEHGLRIEPRQVNNFLPSIEGEGFISHGDPDRARSLLAEQCPQDINALTQYELALHRLAPVLRDLMLTTPPDLTTLSFSDIPRLFQLSRHYGRLTNEDRRLLLKLFTVSAGEILDDLFVSPQLKALLGFDAIVGHYASPYTPGSGYVLLHHVIGGINGKTGTWGHARGGMGAISDAIAAEARSRGVTLVTEMPVERIEVQDRKARAVRTLNGDSFEADIIVAGVNPKLLFCQLIDPAAINPETRLHFEHYKCQSGTFRLNVALNQIPSFTGQPDPSVLTGGVILAPSLDYMDLAYTDARQSGYSASPVVEMMIPSLVDDTLAPPGKHVASLFCQHFDPSLASEWTHRRDQAADTIIDTVDQFAPGFSSTIIARQVHSPWDLEQKFGLVGGDIFHGRLSLDQLFSARPMLGMAQYRTEIDGLWMCSAGTHPGGGVSGVPGLNAAREIIRTL